MTARWRSWLLVFSSAFMLCFVTLPVLAGNPPLAEEIVGTWVGEVKFSKEAFLDDVTTYPLTMVINANGTLKVIGLEGAITAAASSYVNYVTTEARNTFSDKGTTREIPAKAQVKPDIAPAPEIAFRYSNGILNVDEQIIVGNIEKSAKPDSLLGNISQIGADYVAEVKGDFYTWRVSKAATSSPGSIVPSPLPSSISASKPTLTNWLETAPPGLGRIGLIPGPKTALEAIIGVLVPGLIGILGGLLGGLFGNPPPTSATPAVASGGNDVLEDPRAEINRINQQWREASRGVDPKGPGYADFKKGYDDYRQSLQDKIAVDAAARATAPAEPPPKDIEYTYPDGRSTVLVYDPKHGGYINTLTGGLVAHGDIDKWKQNNAQTAQQTDAWRTANKQITAAGLDAQSQALAAIKNRNDQQAKTLANLGKMEKEIIFGNGSVRDLYKAPGEPGNILTNIQNLRQQILDGNGTDLKKYQSIRRLYGDTSSGKAAMPDSIPSQNAQVRDIINTSIKYTVNEVATGQDASGGTSLKGLAVRGLLGWITGGASEVVLVPVQSVTTMKDYVDKGGNSIVGGFVRAVSEVAVSEISNVAVGGLVKGAVSGGKWAGAGFTKVTGSLKEAVNNAAKNGSSAAKTLVSAAENASTKTNAAYDKAVKFWSGEKAPPYKPPADLPKANPTYGTSSVAGARPGAGPTGPLVSTGTGPNIGYVRQPQTPVAPHMTGMPEASIRHAQVVGDKFGVKVDVRPTTPKAAQLLISGEAKPKPGWIKNKTVNELDVYLGAKADNLGKAGHFDPKLPPKGTMPDSQYKDLTDRFNQRQAEYVHNNSSIRNDPRLLVKDGLIIEKASGKPFTGDHDIFDIRGVDGKPVPQAVRDQVIKELSQPPFNAQHGAHMEGGWVKNATLAGIDSTIINGHTLGEPGSKPLITFGPDRPPESTFVVGSR